MILSKIIKLEQKIANIYVHHKSLKSYLLTNSGDG